jgi:HAD superfamily hydrolase (TIGR01509 family)
MQMTVALPKALLFDMDGTVTRPMLDFDAIRAEIGITTGAILEAMAAMSPADRAAAQAILDRHEHHAAERSTLNNGWDRLAGFIVRHNVSTALITRNSRQSVKTVCGLHGLCFGILIAREDAPPKPDPTALLLACERLGITVDQAWMVGDSIYDVRAGLAAGMKTVWVSNHLAKDFQAEPWQTVTTLNELVDLLERCNRFGVLSYK